MPRVQNSWPLLNLYNPALRAQQAPQFNWGMLHHAAGNLAKAVNALHVYRYVVGDLNESNLLIDKNGLITLVDTDSFQVRDERNNRIFFCGVGKPDFTPPELYGKDLKTTERYWHQDTFGLAVLIFMILMEGNHPFTGYPRSGPSVPALIFRHNITQGIFPYEPSSQYDPPRHAPPFSILHPQLQALFRQAFVNSSAAPSARPTARSWADTLDDIKGYLTQCHRNTDHVYSVHQSECPWCRREGELSGASRQTISKTKPNPSPSVVPIPLPKPPSQPVVQHLPVINNQSPTSLGGSVAAGIFVMLLILALIAFFIWLLASAGFI
jgi:DNA-binding helix-hairpin-helix protein with protein kinase domain